MGKRLTFRRHQRLVKNEQFRAVLARKCCAGNELMRLCVAENDLDIPRFGVSVPKRCGNAVLRNRLKRLAREVFRTEQHNLEPSTDYLLIFSPKLSKKSRLADPPKCGPHRGLGLDDLREAFLRLADRAGQRLQQTRRTDRPG